MPGKSYIISYYEIQYYLELMKSSDANIQREGLQKLYQEIGQGRRILPYSKEELKKSLKPLILSPSSKVRKWAYHLGTEVNSYEIISLCRQQLSMEKDTENVNWILSVLSTCYNDEELKDILKKEMPHNSLLTNLTGIQIEASRAMYAKDKNIRNTESLVQELRKGAPAIRSWLTKFYAYRNVAENSGLQHVTQKDMLSLITDGDPGLQEYGMWALYLHERPDLKEIPKDLLDYNYYSDDARKWFFQFAVNISELVNEYEFVSELIEKHAEFNRSAREGLIFFLLNAKFHKKYVERITDWYISEEVESVKRLLLSYMTQNVWRDTTTTFFTILESEFQNPSAQIFIESEICLHPELDLEIENGRLQKKGRNVVNNNFYGEVKNPTFIENYYQDDLRNLIPAINKMNDCLDHLSDIPEEAITACRENIELVKEQIRSQAPKKSVMQKALTGIKKFAQDFTVQLSADLAATYLASVNWQESIALIEAFLNRLL